MEVTRRGLLAGAAVGGGLVVAWALFPRSYPVPLRPGRDEYVFGAWLKIARDGVVTVAVPQLEMGQGVTTIIPQIVAVELGADWRQVAVEPAPPSGTYGNIPLAAQWSALWMPFATGLADQPGDIIAQRYAQGTRFAATANGTTLAAYEQPCREAAATARAMLTQAAAERWDVPPEECEAEAGFVIHQDKRASFAELVEEASALDPPELPALRGEAAAEEPVAGEADAPSAFPRLDLPSKVDGSHLFAGDVRLPDMVYAAIRQGPMPGGTLAGFEAAKVAGRPELIQLVRGNDWLAAVATNWWAAERALTDIAPRFTVGDPPDTDTMVEQLDTALREGESYRVAERGDEPDFEQPDLALRYEVAPAPHATLETASVTAHLVDGQLRLWMASQSPEHARAAAAKAVDVAMTDTVLYPMPAGGSFDRRLEHDHAIQAALLAREVGRPVQLVWSRWQEMLAAPPRTPVAAVLSAKYAPDGQGRMAALKTRLAQPATAREFGARLFDNNTAEAAMEAASGEADPLACTGAMPPYDIPNAAVDHVPVRLRLPTGRMRANADGYTAFFRECFVDEVATRNGREPLSYRIEMLGGDLRLVECLQRAARAAGWGGGRDRSGQGIACHLMGEHASGGRIACVATARPGEGGIRVETLHAAVDIGRIVNLDIARQQIEGGLVFGLGLALGRALSYRGGLASPERLAALDLPRLADCPRIEVDFVASEAEPFDPGELGTAVVAPAIANALYSAGGTRLRRLPLLSDGL